MTVQSKLKAPKNQYNSFGNYKYRSCEDILEGLKPILAENKALVVLTDTIEQIGDRIYVKATATFVDVESGEKLEVNALAREDETKKGMDLAQITGSVSSYARKYALNGLFCIDDTKDSDATNTHGNDDNSKPSKNAPQSTEGHQGSTGTPTGKLSEKQVKRLYAIANNKGIKPEQVKQAILKDFKKTSAEDLVKSEYDALIGRLEKAGEKSA